MKKIIILIILLITTGCSINYKGTERIESDLIGILNYEISGTNTSGKGFKYYKPRDFSLLEDKDYNHVLVHNGTKYYLNIDINAYYNKFIPNYTIDKEIYYSNIINNGDLKGYVEVRETKNSYFYIKMLYNYSYVEVKVSVNEINEAINNSLVILSSIRYNDNIIEEFISNKDVSNKETTYEIKKPDNILDNKNILDVYEYDSYKD